MQKISHYNDGYSTLEVFTYDVNDVHKNSWPIISFYKNYAKDIVHRLDGPAAIFLNGKLEWWIDGEKINCSSQLEFEKILKLKVFL